MTRQPGCFVNTSEAKHELQLHDKQTYLLSRFALVATCIYNLMLHGQKICQMFLGRWGLGGLISLEWKNCLPQQMTLNTDIILGIRAPAGE